MYRTENDWKWRGLTKWSVCADRMQPGRGSGKSTAAKRSKAEMEKLGEATRNACKITRN